MRPISLKTLSGALFITLCAATTAFAATTEADSLSAALSRARTPAEREQTYVRLADLCANSTALAVLYWEAALTEAAGAGDDYGCREALDRLVQGFSAKQPERALEYVRLADSLLPDRRFALFRASLNAFWLWKQMSVANSFEAIDRALAEFRERQPGSLTPEEEIEWEFLTGLSIDYSSIATEAYGNIPQAIPYVEQALAKLEKYPLEERVHFEKLCREELADIYLYADDPRAAGQIGRCIDLHRAWVAADKRFERPRRDSAEYLMRSYGKMVFLGGLLTREEVDGYYDKCMELARGRGDREEIYNTSARYYRDRGDYERSTAYMDSLLTHYAETGKKADLGSIYIAQSHLYEKAGDYAKALEAMRKGNDFRYHSRMDQAQSKLAEMFSNKVGIDGVVLTKLDGDTRGGAALSIRAVSGKPILYVGMGEKLSDLEQFYPDRMASRILGMGDVMSLIEKAQANIDEEKAKAMEQKMKKAQFDFNDYLDSMEQMRNMGGISSILNMLPGVGAKMKGQDLESMVDEKDMARKEAIVLSMTPKERENPDLINPSRKQRIAKGAGVDIAEVNRFIKQFEQSRKMMKQMTGMVGKGGKRGGFKLPF